MAKATFALAIAWFRLSPPFWFSNWNALRMLHSPDESWTCDAAAPNQELEDVFPQLRAW